MSEDEGVAVAPRDHAHDAARYGEALLYDFAKFLITLPLLVLGAMLTLGQAARAGDVKLVNIYLVVGSLSATAIVAFAVAHALTDARARHREPPTNLPGLLKFATALLGIGIGGFLMLWIDTLS